jgi:hypothetical protein
MFPKEDLRGLYYPLFGGAIAYGFKDYNRAGSIFLAGNLGEIYLSSLGDLYFYFTLTSTTFCFSFFPPNEP